MPDPYQNGRSLKAAPCAWVGIGVSLFAFLLLFVPSLRPATSCNGSQEEAVACFVANAVTTKLTAPRYGMTLTQFQSYGIAVSRIMQSDQAYLVLFSTASAISDAMPAINANGIANVAAQDLAVEQIVAAAVANGILSTPEETTTQQMEFFALDLVSTMNGAKGMVQIMSPGATLRVVDSYLITGTTGGQPNWPKIYSGLSGAVNNLLTAGTMRLPSSVSSNDVKGFLQAMAKAIYSYKQATGRTSL